MDDVKRYDVQGKFESTNGEGISLLNPKMVLEQDYDAKCHAAEVYFGSWKRTEQELDAQRLRADTAEAELKAIKESMAYRGSLFGQVQAQRDSAEQRIASIAGEPAKCKECGSDALFWFDSNTNTSGIMEGRLRTNEITCTFVLGCADCSATIKTVRAETIAARMTYYDQGWNDYVDGIIPDFTTGECPYTKDYKDGWQDCVEATERYGKQVNI